MWYNAIIKQLFRETFLCAALSAYLCAREQGRKDEEEASLLTQGKKTIFLAIHLLLGKPRGDFLPVTNCKKKKKSISKFSLPKQIHTHSTWQIKHVKWLPPNGTSLKEQELCSSLHLVTQVDFGTKIVIWQSKGCSLDCWLVGSFLPSEFQSSFTLPLLHRAKVCLRRLWLWCKHGEAHIKLIWYTELAWLFIFKTLIQNLFEWIVPHQCTHRFLIPWGLHREHTIGLNRLYNWTAVIKCQASPFFNRTRNTTAWFNLVTQLSKLDGL